MARIGINGFGRIGRQVLRAMMERYPSLEVAAVNDLADVRTNAHLFKYDSTYGRFPGTVETQDGRIVINGRRVNVLSAFWGAMAVGCFYFLLVHAVAYTRWLARPKPATRQPRSKPRKGALPAVKWPW